MGVPQSRGSQVRVLSPGVECLPWVESKGPSILRPGNRAPRSANPRSLHSLPSPSVLPGAPVLPSAPNPREHLVSASSPPSAPSTIRPAAAPPHPRHSRPRLLQPSVLFQQPTPQPSSLPPPLAAAPARAPLSV